MYFQIESVHLGFIKDTIPNLKRIQILKVIKKKEFKIADYYKQKADYIILLLVEGILPESWFDRIEAIEKAELDSNFDRILIYRVLYNEVIRLK